MRALVLEKFGSMVVRELPDPSPGVGEVMIRTVVTGICGSDLHGYTGDNGRRAPGQVMGHETAGRIAALGPGVRRVDLAVGAAVSFNPVIVPEDELDRFAGREQHAPHRKLVGVDSDIISAFAEYVVIPERNVVPLPEGMPIELGALVEPFAVAVHALHRAAPKPGERLVVVGAGPIGQSVVLAAQFRGIRDILVAEIGAERRDFVELLGARAVDPRVAGLASVVAEMWGVAADIGIDAVGISETMHDLLAATTLGARVILLGMGSPVMNLDVFPITTAERSIIGSFTYAASEFVGAAQELADNAGLAARLISEEVDLLDAPATFARMAADHLPVGKVLVRLGEGD